MTDSTPDPGEFRILGDLPQSKRDGLTTAIVDANVAIARTNPGQWCIVYSYPGAPDVFGPRANQAKFRLAQRHPDIEAKIRTIDGAVRIVVRTPVVDA